ncbi:MAG: SCO family protein [Cyclobacteriaceae bacterium]
MKFILKAGILLFTLAVPVFIWLFLKNFGQNQYEVPVYYTQGIDSLAYCESDTGVHQVPEFSLTSLAGEDIDQQFLDNQLTVTYILPEVCDEDCQLVMEEMARLQDVFSDEENFKMLTIGRDPASLKQMAERYNRRTDKWFFLYGSRDSLQELSSCGFVLSREESAKVTLVLTDEFRRIRGYYEGNSPEEADRLILEMKILLYLLDA